MKKILFALILILATAACTGKSKGWSQVEKDTLVTSCVTEASKNPSLDKAKLTAYCSCYQQDLEKKHPDINDLAKLSEDEMSKSAEGCLPLVLK